MRVPPELIATSAARLANDADDLKAELTGLTGHWSELSSTWTGKAARAYEPAWEDWHRHAEAIADLLDESSERLLRAVTVYVESEAARANRVTAVRSAEVDW